MASIFAHEFFPDCGCCSSSCVRGTLEVQARGGTFTRQGYTALNGDASLGLYSTLVSRGWGGYGLLSGNTLNGPTENDASCAYEPPFIEGGGTATFDGSLISRLWITGAGFPWPDDVNVGTPDVEITDCADGIIPFATPDSENPTEQHAYSLDYPDYVPPGPQGSTYLLNLQDAEEVFELLRTHVDGLSWPSGVEACYPSPCSTGRVYVMHRPVLWTTIPEQMAHTRARFRQRFRIPASGVFRLEIDIWFVPYTPSGSIPADLSAKVLYDTISWQWDEEVPAGYDEADPDTWPVTPWFDMPDYDPDAGYGDFFTEYDDTRVFCSTALAAEPPTEAEVEQIP